LLRGLGSKDASRGIGSGAAEKEGCGPPESLQVWELERSGVKRVAAKMGLDSEECR